MERKPLTGIRVLDFTWVRAGPWATRWMAGLGAEVIKVEWVQPGSKFFSLRTTMTASTPTRIANPGHNTGGNFNDTNAGKLGITLNVRSPEGFELTKRLLAQSDIVIENFSSRVMRNWGLSYEEMAAIKPDIIYISMAGLGQEGRSHHHQTGGPTVQAISGLTYLSGLPGQPPAGWGWSYMDDTGGLFGLMSTLSALHHRNMTGEGQHIDMSQVAAGMTLVGPSFLDVTVNGRPQTRPGFPPGNRTVWPGTPVLHNYRGPIAVPHNSYRTAGGGYNDWCVIACFSDSDWRALVGAMGSPSWAADPALDTLEGRLAQQEQIDAQLEAWTKTLGKYEVAQRLQAAGIAAMPVQSNEDRVEHDLQLRSRQQYVPIYHAELGTNLFQNFPFRLSETPVAIEKPAPLVGEHTRVVLDKLLGVGEEAYLKGIEEDLFWPQVLPVEEYLRTGTGLQPVVEPSTAPGPKPLDSERARPRRNSGPLSDLRVIELADEKGQWCGKLLADLGADVIKVERPGGSDERKVGPFLNDEEDPNGSLYFWHYNTNKRSVTLDLDTEDGREALRALAATADVLLETYAPGTMAAWGLGQEALRALNPRLIVCSLTSWGQDGPWAHYRGSDLIHLAAGGQMSCCGYSEVDIPDAPPIAPGGGNAWHIGGHYAFVAIMSAVVHRDFTGQGQYIDTSVHGACALSTEMHNSAWVYRKDVVTRATGRHAGTPPPPPSQFLCANGKYVNTSLQANNLKQLDQWVQWMDAQGFAHDLHDPKYRAEGGLVEHRPEVARTLQAFVRSISSEEAYHGMQDRGIGAGAVRTPEDALADPHWEDRGFFVEVEHPERGKSFRYPGAAAIWGKSAPPPMRRAPLLGEHTDEVLQEVRAL